MSRPRAIEGLLIAEPEIAQAVVLGEGRAGLTALVVAAEGCDEMAVATAVSNVNKRLSVTERIRRHATVAPFTIDNGMLTATQKIRRHVVTREHAESCWGASPPEPSVQAATATFSACPVLTSD